MSVLRAAVVSSVVSGGPSTLWGLARGRDPLEATWAAGQLVLPGEPAGPRLLAAAALSHGLLSLAWTIVLNRALPVGTRGKRALFGAAAGCAIAALDLGAAHAMRSNSRLAAIGALPLAPQVADHVAFGALVGWSL